MSTQNRVGQTIGQYELREVRSITCLPVKMIRRRTREGHHKVGQCPDYLYAGEFFPSSSLTDRVLA
jgi:hypothetical protein